MLKQQIIRFAPLGTMLIFPFLGMLYALTNGPDERVYSLMTDLDYAIPFVKYFILPYSVWIFYIYVCLIYFFIKDPKTYFRTLVTYSVCTLVCYLIYSVFQTTVPRPMLAGVDFFTRLLAYVYNRDMPYNCFPSIHCFSSFMVMKVLYTTSFKNRMNQTLIYGMSSIIIVSTLLVKQHAIMDALAGFLLVEVVLWALGKLERTIKPAFSNQQT